MNANDAIDELRRYDTKADEQWHGNRLQLRSNSMNENSSKRRPCFANSRFEIIDCEERTASGKLDALQNLAEQTLS
jgi:hypothetical protein